MKQIQNYSISYKLEAKSFHAFTLLEATIILFLVAMSATILAGVSMNNLSSRFYADRENLKNDLRRAKAMALNPIESADRFCSAGINIQPGKYTLFFNENCDGTIDAGDLVQEEVKFSPGIVVLTPVTVNFKIPYGEAVDTSGKMLSTNQIVTIGSSGGQYQTDIKVTPLGLIYQ